MNNADGLYYKYIFQDVNFALPFSRTEDVYTKKYKFGYSPSQINKAYGINNVCEGNGVTIAIVGAFDVPTLSDDYETFCETFHLPGDRLEIIYAEGECRKPDPAWEIEAALAVQWSRAIAPRANIIYIVSPSNSINSLSSALQIAIDMGADIISIGWGEYEATNQTVFDKIFSPNHVIYVAGVGERAKVFFPSNLPNVLKVGGTTLKLLPDGTRVGEETVWGRTGGGISDMYEIPECQKIFENISDLTNSMCGIPDVSFLANPKTGVAVYHGFLNNGKCGWTVCGGTSLGAYAWAGIIARAKEAGKKHGDMKSMHFGYINPLLYKLAGKTSYHEPQYNFIDITEGGNGKYTALKGWDLCTGLGSPVARQIIENIWG